MLVLSFWALGMALIVVQTTLLEHLPLWFGRPDFVFIVVAFAAYRFAWIPGIVVVFALGWVLDVVAGIYLGLYPLIYLLLYAALKVLNDRIPVKESTYQIPLVGVSHLLLQMFFFFAYSVILPETVPEWSWFRTLERTVLVVVAAIPLFVVFNRLHEYILKRPLRGKPTRRRPRQAL